MARVKCITMQRDETELLPAWLRYHGHLFGFENLVVFDNGSTDRRVVRVLHQAARAGVDVRWTHRGMRDFELRGQHARNILRHWGESGAKYDFVMPLDCDEFVAMWTPTGLECRREPLLTALDGLIGERRALAMPEVLFNVPHRPGWFVLETQGKCFLPANSEGTIEDAFRSAMSGREAGVRETRFVTLHFRNKPFPELRARARRRMEAGAGVSRHLAFVLDSDEASFLDTFDEKLLVGFPGFGDFLAALGIECGWMGAPAADAHRVGPGQVAFLRVDDEEGAVWFDGAAYLELNPDVARANLPAAMHFARHGESEGRGVPALEW